MKKVFVCVLLLIVSLSLVSALDLKVSISPFSYQVVKYKGHSSDPKNYPTLKSKSGIGVAGEIISPLNNGFSLGFNLSYLLYTHTEDRKYNNLNFVALLGYSHWFKNSLFYWFANIGGGGAVQKHKDVTNVAPALVLETGLGYNLTDKFGLEFTLNGQYNYQGNSDEKLTASVFNLRTYLGGIFHFGEVNN